MSLVPDLRKCAILLDIDGTILDLAPSPQQVWVPTGLRQTLARLDALTGGALALVSGRSLNDIDLIFSPLELAAIGGHGAELRAAADAEPVMRAKPLSAALKRNSPASPNSAPAFSPRTKAIRWRCIIGWRRKKAMPCAPRSIRSAPLRRRDRRNSARQARRGDQAGRHQQGDRGVRTDGLRAIRGPQSDLHRRRHHRRAGVRHHFAIRRLGLFRRPGRVPDVNGHFEKPESVRAWLARIADKGSRDAQRHGIMNDIDVG